MNEIPAIVDFGKHRGEKVSEVPTSYIRWAKKELGITKQQITPEAILKAQELEKDGEWLCPKCNEKNYLTDKCKYCGEKIDIMSPIIKGNEQPDENGNLLVLRGYYEIKAYMENKLREEA